MSNESYACEGCALDMPEALKQRLSDEERAAFEAHLEACAACARTWANMQRAALALQRAYPVNEAGQARLWHGVRVRLDQTPALARRSSAPIVWAAAAMSVAAALVLVATLGLAPGEPPSQPLFLTHSHEPSEREAIPPKEKETKPTQAKVALLNKEKGRAHPDVSAAEDLAVATETSQAPVTEPKNTEVEEPVSGHTQAPAPSHRIPPEVPAPNPPSVAETPARGPRTSYSDEGGLLLLRRTGPVAIYQAELRDWRALVPGERAPYGAKIRTAADARVEFAFEESRLKLDERTEAEVRREDDGTRIAEVAQGRLLIDLLRSEAGFKVRSGRGEVSLTGTIVEVEAPAPNVAFARIREGHVKIVSARDGETRHLQAKAGDEALLTYAAPADAIAALPQVLRERARALAAETDRILPLPKDGKRWDETLDQPPGRSEAAVGQLVVKDEQGREADPMIVERLDVRAVVRGPEALTRVDQTFRNTTSRQLEGTYYFPLPPGAAISRFAMYVDDAQTKLIEGEVVERQQARAIFDSILRKRRDPALLEWMEGNLFKARIFPIPANGVKRVILEYTQLLPAFHDTRRYVFPLVNELTVKNPIETLSIRVDAWGAEGAAIERAYSPSYPRQTRIEGAGSPAVHAHLEMRAVRPSSDFVLTLVSPRTSEIQAAAYGETNEAPYLLVGYQPKLDATAQTNARPTPGLDVMLVLETSGARQPKELDAQTRVAAAMIAGLDRTRDRVALAAADVSLTPITDGFLHTYAAMLPVDLDLLSKRAPMGALDLGAVLREGAACFPKENPERRERLLVFIGAGVPSLGTLDAGLLADEGTEALRKANARFVAVGLGGTVDANVLSDLARRTQGFFWHVKIEEGLDEAAFLLGLSLQTPLIESVRLSGTGDALTDIYPTTLNALLPGREVFVHARVKPEAAKTTLGLTLTGLLSDKLYERSAAYALPANLAADPAVGRFWARAKLDEMLTRSASEHLRSQVVDLAQTWTLMSPYTSFLVLESDEEYTRYGIDRAKRRKIWREEPVKPEPGRETKTLARVEPVLESRIIRLAHLSAGDAVLPSEEGRAGETLLDVLKRMSGPNGRLTFVKRGTALVVTDTKDCLDALEDVTKAFDQAKMATAENREALGPKFRAELGATPSAAWPAGIAKVLEQFNGEVPPTATPKDAALIHLDAAKRLFASIEYQGAQRELEQAKALDGQNGEVAEWLGRVNGVLDMRRERIKTASDGLFGHQKVQVQERLAELEQRIEWGEVFQRKAKDEARSFPERIRAAGQALKSLERANEIVKWMPPNISVDEQQNALLRMERETRKLLQKTEEAFVLADKKAAADLSLERSDLENANRERAIRTTLDQAQGAFDRGDYGRARTLSDKVLDQDPTNSAAHLINAVSSAHRTAAGESNAPKPGAADVPVDANRPEMTRTYGGASLSQALRAAHGLPAEAQASIQEAAATLFESLERMHASETQGLEVPKDVSEENKKVVVAAQLESIRNAQTLAQRAREILNHLPPEIDFPEERKQVEEALPRLRGLLTDKEDELSFLNRLQAQKAAEQARERGDDAFKKRIKLMNKRAELLLQIGDPKAAEALALQVLVLDPFNNAAEALKTKARSDRQHWIEEEAKDRKRTEALLADNLGLPHGAYLLYPDSWRGIAQRTEKTEDQAGFNYYKYSVSRGYASNESKDGRFVYRSSSSDLRKDYNEVVRDTWEDKDNAHIPYGNLLTYPPNWDEIARRPERTLDRWGSEVDQVRVMAEEISDAQGAPRRAAMREELKRKLGRHVSFEFVDTPLNEAVQFLGDLTHANITIDPKLAADLPKAPISLRVSDMSTDMALEWVAKLADLDVQVRHDGVFITKKANLADSVELEIYDVSDLTQVVPNFPGPRLELGTSNNSAVSGIASDDFRKELAGLKQELANLRAHTSPGPIATTHANVEPKYGPNANTVIDRNLLDRQVSTVGSIVNVNEVVSFFPLPLDDTRSTQWTDRPFAVPGYYAWSGYRLKTHPPLRTREEILSFVREGLKDEFEDPTTSIEEAGGRLVVMQRPETQEKIRRILADLRAGTLGSVRTGATSEGLVPVLLADGSLRWTTPIRFSLDEIAPRFAQTSDEAQHERKPIWSNGIQTDIGAGIIRGKYDYLPNAPTPDYAAVLRSIRQEMARPFAPLVEDDSKEASSVREQRAIASADEKIAELRRLLEEQKAGEASHHLQLDAAKKELEIERLKQEVLKAQEIVQRNKAQSASENASRLEMLNDLKSTRQTLEAIKRDRNAVKEDLAIQTKRIETLLTKNVPVFEYLQEDPEASSPRPNYIKKDPETANPKPSIPWPGIVDAPTIITESSSAVEIERELDRTRKELASMLRDKRAIEDDLGIQTRRIETLLAKNVPVWEYLQEDPETTQPYVPDASVLAVKPELNMVMISVGSAQGVKPGMRFTISRGDRYVTKAQVERVYPDMASCRLLLKKDEVQLHDEVRSRVSREKQDIVPVPSQDDSSPRQPPAPAPKTTVDELLTALEKLPLKKENEGLRASLYLQAADLSQESGACLLLTAGLDELQWEGEQAEGLARALAQRIQAASRPLLLEGLLERVKDVGLRGMILARRASLERNANTACRLWELAYREAGEAGLYRAEYALALEKTGRTRAAIELLEGCLRKGVNDGRIYQALGRLYEAAGDRASALRAITQDVALRPREAEPRKALANLFQKQGRVLEALREWRSACEFAPERADLHRAMLALARARDDREAWAWVCARMLEGVWRSEDGEIRKEGSEGLKELEALYRKDGQQEKARAIKDRADAARATDLVVVLSWDTDKTDIDLHIDEPGQNHVSYQSKSSFRGGVLDHDDTDGYGPETYTLKRAAPGIYRVWLRYYSGNTPTEAKVKVTCHEGAKAEETRTYKVKMEKSGAEAEILRFEWPLK